MDACLEKTMETGDNAEAVRAMSRKEKRKLLKKEKRQQRRKEIAVREKEEEEARLNDAEEQSKLIQLEQQELDKMEIDRREFEERERRFLEVLELNRRRELEEYEQAQERERERQKLAEEYRAKQAEDEIPAEMDKESNWEYVEEGPAEIIWQGNEIIVKKKRVRVPKKNLEQQIENEDVARPISNPLAPQSEAFDDCKSVQHVLDTVAQEVPYFGTEQDKAHCPFHLKTGACRFGTRCSRVHFYPDKSCTILMKNMYGGLGLMWEQDEGLEHTDEEIEHSFEEFYEDVHTEFLKFGEIVNFKVCRNSSPHLRGNVYVHYKSLESAVLAYQSTNGRYFAGKQVSCEFVNLTRWKVAICGEYMRSRLKTCSRGSACNFIHCFRNPDGEYEWADWDRTPPRYWISKMAALFGNEDGYDKQLDEVSPDKVRSAPKSIPMNADSRQYSRSRSRELFRRHSASNDDNGYTCSKRRQWRPLCQGRANSFDKERYQVKMSGKDNHYIRGRSPNVYSGDDKSDREWRRTNYEEHKKGCRSSPNVYSGDDKSDRELRRTNYEEHKKGCRSRWRSEEINSESGSDRDISVKEGRERCRKDYRSHRSKPDRDGKSNESDSSSERSVKDGSQRYHEDRIISGQKTRDSFRSDYELYNREDTHQNDPEGYHEDSICKHSRYRNKSSSLQDDILDSCTSDRDPIVSEEGCDVDRRRSSQLFHLSEQTQASHRDKHRRRESSKHRKRETSRPPKSERRSSRKHRKDPAGSNVTLSDMEEACKRVKRKRRKQSAWDLNKAKDRLVTPPEDHLEREDCDLENHEDAEGNSTSVPVEFEFEKEQACRRFALEKLQEKQLQKQPTPINSSHNVEGSVVSSDVSGDQNDVEAEPRKRRRI
ncbi:hypothetical protein V2J09_022375 [Rumex salicifolius]